MPTPIPVPAPSAPVQAPLPDSPQGTVPVEPEPVYAAGLLAEYFNNKTLSDSPVLVRTDAAINFNWRQGSPDAALGADNFSVRWTGTIKPKYSETYKFYMQADDGVRLWIDGQLIIDGWVKQSGVDRSGTIALTAGQMYDIKVEYFENQGDASAKMIWESPSQPWTTVPASALFSLQ